MWKSFIKKLRRTNNKKEVFIGAGTYSVVIPPNYITERDEKEGTVLVYPKGSECITLRFDVLSYQAEDGEEVDLGYNVVMNEAREKEDKLTFINEKAVAFREDKANDQGVDLVMKYWTVGPRDSRIILMSATILEELKHDKRVTTLLNHIPCILKSIEPTEKHDALNTIHGEVQYVTKTLETHQQEFKAINKDDKQFINQWIENGKNIIKYYHPRIDDLEISIDLLDKVFEKWLYDHSEEKFNDESIARGLGIWFGQLLSVELGMKWVKVIDEYGEDFAVRHKNETTSYPLSTVLKRIEQKETGFFYQVYEITRYTIENQK